MQILHRTLGSIQQYLRDIKESSAADRYRPDPCPLCQARHSFLAHGFYYRTLVHVDFDQVIAIRRYLCRLCRRTVSLLPDFVLPYLRHSTVIIGLFLVSRLLAERSLQEAAQAAFQPNMPYQRGQFCTALSYTSGRCGRCLGQLDSNGNRTGFRYPGLADAGSDWLDRGALLSVWEVAHALAGLAALSHSPPWSYQFSAACLQLLTANTQHLPRRESPSALVSRAGRFPMDAKAEKIALFRYGLVAPLVLESLPRGELLRRAREIAARQYEIPGSQRISLSPATLLKWARRYREDGFEALGPKPRQDRGQSRSISPQLAELIERLKRENPHRAGTTLLRELALSVGSRVV